MAKGLPYYRWYPADAEIDEKYASMTDAELGFYHRCLNKSWTNYGLPADLDALAAMMRVKRSYLDRVWVNVGKCFTPTDTVHQRLVNPRQEEEREYAISKSNKASSSSAHRVELKAPGSIYLIQRSDGAVKIGSAINVPRRLAQLKYKYQDSLTLIGQFAVASMGDAELSLHNKFKGNRISGEWFALSKEQLSEVIITLGGDSGGDTRGDRGGDIYDHPAPRAYDSESVSDSCVSSSKEVLPFIPPAKSYTMDEPFMRFMGEVALTGAPLIDADYIDAHSEWSHMDMPERMLAISNFKEKREAGIFADPAMVMRPHKWLKRKEFNRRAVQARASPRDLRDQQIVANLNAIEEARRQTRG
jgi:hypothetical protein